MKNITKYCSRCEKATVHTMETENAYETSGALRVVTSLVSFGLGELDTTTTYQCCECGKESYD